MSLAKILAMPEGPVRTAAIVALVQSFCAGSVVPVLVGGGAVEIYTGGAYVTGDLDFAGVLTPEALRSLEAEGFVRHGRHLVHEAAQLYLEFPSRALAPQEESQRRRVGKHSILIVSFEDLLVDRLAAWVFWHSAVDGVNAFLLWRKRPRNLDLERLMKRAKASGVDKALASLLRFARGRTSQKALESWALKGTRQ
ncbi:MAG: hypothetical protein JHC34_08325 [Acidobacteria bacterium]|jgi:hypothetical protein|nr:hypothetical protein [Acidobacteriota bacterium]